MTHTAVILEDEPDIADMFITALEGTGFEVLHFFDGAEGSNYLAENTPDLIVLDLNMPEVNGEEVLYWIRDSPHLSGTKVIVASADALWAQDMEGIADLVLLKPVSIQQLSNFARIIVST